MWHDYVFAAGAVVFIIALLPAMRSKEKPPLSTSLTTSFVLFIFALNYFSLHLWFATLTTAGTSLQWLILAVQKHRQSGSDK